jgi:hypothetical protein
MVKMEDDRPIGAARTDLPNRRLVPDCENIRHSSSGKQFHEMSSCKTVIRFDVCLRPTLVSISGRMNTSTERRFINRNLCRKK